MTISAISLAYNSSGYSQPRVRPMASAMSSWFISTGPTRIDLAVVRFRILQQGGDDVGLILTGDGGVPPGAHGQS